MTDTRTTYWKKNLSIAPEILLLQVCNGPDPLSPHILKTQKNDLDLIHKNITYILVSEKL